MAATEKDLDSSEESRRKLIIVNAHYDLAVKLREKGANPNVEDIAGTGALYAAVDMNSMQWIQGRPQPILSDSIDGSELVRILLQKGAVPMRAFGATR